MGKKKLKRYRVQLFASLPCSTTMEVEAENVDAAKEYAEEHSNAAPWNGADYNTPDGCLVEVGKIEEIK